MEKAGKYEILRKIGSGGFGVVYEGRDPFIKRRVAIKTCTSEDEDIRQRFFREAEIAGNLQHKNIVTIHDFGLEDGIPYLVQEYLTGEDLLHAVNRRDPLPLERKLDILLQVAHGMAYAHSQGVIHRDIKPANVRLLEDGRVKIMDFGIAKLAHVESGLTKEGMTVGTAAYLPPEQIRGEKVDTRADIFSFGVLAYELLGMVRPFDGKTLSTLLYQILSHEPKPLAEVRPDLPPRVTRIVMRCLEKEAANRCPSFDEVGAELSVALTESSRASDLAAAQPTMAMRRPEVPAEVDPRTELAPIAEEVRRVLANGDLTAAEIEIARARQRFGSETVFEQILGPLYSEVVRARERQQEESRRALAEQQRLRREAEELARAEAARARRQAALAAELVALLEGGELARAESALARADAELGGGTFDRERRQLAVLRTAQAEAERQERERLRLEREQDERRRMEEARRAAAEERSRAVARARERVERLLTAGELAKARREIARGRKELGDDQPFVELAARLEALEADAEQTRQREAAERAERERERARAAELERQRAAAEKAERERARAKEAEEKRQRQAAERAERERAETAAAELKRQRRATEEANRARARSLEAALGPEVSSSSYASPAGSLAPRTGRRLALIAAGVGALALLLWLIVGRDRGPRDAAEAAPPERTAASAAVPPALVGVSPSTGPPPAVAPPATTARETEPIAVDPPEPRRSEPESRPAPLEPPRADDRARAPEVERPQPAPAARQPTVASAPPVVAQRPPEPAPVATPQEPAAAPAAAPDESAGVRAALASYRAAYEALDASRVHAIWPAIDAAAVRQIARAFEGYNSLSMGIDDCRYEVAGDRATASCRVGQRIDVKVGRDIESSQQVTFVLRRSGDRWTISERTAR